ncbi:MAG: YgiQ family radical SAM protein [Bacteroidales bacterium]|nr:YgiQ family radical SAM protein [Candidatus Physcousia equi]
MKHDLTHWLPTTRKEMELRGWDSLDVILLSGDAYVDHPSFGVAVIGRLLEAEGLRVGIIPQPDWHGDLRDFKRLGRPRLFFGISPGCMDSMVNKYTAARRLRSEDAYSPDGRHDMRPEYPTIVYTQCLRQLFPDVPIVLGGIEASLRRLSHYDYWQDRFLPSILCLCDADVIAYGMGEKNDAEMARRLLALIEEYDETLSYDEDGAPCASRATFRKALLSPDPQRQTGMVFAKDEALPRIDDQAPIRLHSFPECINDLRQQAENFKHIEEESNRMYAAILVQETNGKQVVVFPPYPPLTTGELDHSFDLPYTRLPHPKYQGKRIPAFDMIKFSVNCHRGCFGGCSFCTISAHQGKFIMSRSKESIVREVKEVTKMDGFKGYLSDLGGPSANMYQMRGRNKKACEACRRPSCIHPNICPNLNADHRPLLDVYHAVDALPAIKKSFIGSGVRYDLLLHPYKDQDLAHAASDYTAELIRNHVSGRLKVAPEHTSDRVLELMRKPSFSLYRRFKQVFDNQCRRERLNQQIIPYFISSHPGCTEEDMAELAVITRELGLHLEQVQDFTPTPMTLATEAWATGYHPYTLEPVFSARSPRDKQAQRLFFFWYKPEEQRRIIDELHRIGRADLVAKLVGPTGAPQGSRRKR